MHSFYPCRFNEIMMNCQGPIFMPIDVYQYVKVFQWLFHFWRLGSNQTPIAYIFIFKFTCHINCILWIRNFKLFVVGSTQALYELSAEAILWQHNSNLFDRSTCSWVRNGYLAPNVHPSYGLKFGWPPFYRITELFPNLWCLCPNWLIQGISRGLLTWSTRPHIRAV